MTIKLIKLEKSSNAVVVYDNEQRQEIQVTMPEPVHEDFLKIIRELKAHVVGVFRLMGPLSERPKEEWSSAENSYHEILMRDLQPYILKFGGENAMGNVEISTKLLMLDDKTIVIKSPAIKFEADDYQQAQALLDICKRLKEETLLYLFQSKNAISMGLDFEKTGNDRKLLRLQPAEEGDSDEGPTSEDDPEAVASDNLDKMTFQELKAVAEELQINVIGKTTPVLRDLIREARALEA